MFLGRVREGARLVPWHATAVFGVGAVVDTWLWPQFWIVAMGAIAVVIGIERWSIAERGRVAKPAAGELRKVGQLTVLIGLGGLILGLLYRLIVTDTLPLNVDGEILGQLIEVGTYACAVVLAVLGVWMITDHTSTEALDAALADAGRRKVLQPTGTSDPLVRDEA